MKRAALLLLATTMLAACGDIGMDRQPKYLAQAPGRPALAPPPGVVALGQVEREAKALQPPPVTLALVTRGRERHAIACAPCHGALGDGGGAVVTRGFPQPPAYTDARLRQLSGRQIYDAITDGYGVMLPQAERLSPEDRWAVIAYVRALQSRPDAAPPAGARS